MNSWAHVSYFTLIYWLPSMLFGVSAGNIARTYTEQCMGILTELLGFQQEHITSGNHLQVFLHGLCFQEMALLVLVIPKYEALEGMWHLI